MCYEVRLTSGAEKLKERFGAAMCETIPETGELNGIDHPLLPVITNEKPEEIQLFHWGLIPSWTNHMDTRRKTLNAPLEKLEQQLSFKESVTRRCLILVDGFYEHETIDPKRDLLQKYLLTIPGKKPFALAGLWREGIAPNGEFLQTVTIITTEAQGIIRGILGNSNRMPLVIPHKKEKEWLLSDQPVEPHYKLNSRMVGGNKRLGELQLF